jgi:hypothetical protein
VLNVISAEHHWLNALLISGLDDRFLAAVDEREKGYDRIKVTPSYVRCYHPLSTKPRNIYTHVGKEYKQSDSILPNASYWSICLEGAKQWGEGFYNDFLDLHRGRYLAENLRRMNESLCPRDHLPIRSSSPSREDEPGK